MTVELVSMAHTQYHTLTRIHRQEPHHHHKHRHRPARPRRCTWRRKLAPPRALQSLPRRADAFYYNIHMALRVIFCCTQNFVFNQPTKKNTARVDSPAHVLYISGSPAKTSDDPSRAGASIIITIIPFRCARAASTTRKPRGRMQTKPKSHHRPRTTVLLEGAFAVVFFVYQTRHFRVETQKKPTHADRFSRESPRDAHR